MIYANYRKVAKRDAKLAKTIVARDYKGFGTGFDTMNAVVHETDTNNSGKERND